MVKLNPIRSEKIWGYEDWIASTHPDGCQPEFLAAVGADYPLLVKIIQANDTLSVQVHPDDEKAVLLEGAGNRGKTECWYVLDAKPGAKLVYGLNGTPSTGELRAAIDGGSLESHLNFVPVKKGEFIFIPAGTVHAIGGGLRLLEVQQSCNLTYRLYDWNRGRELHKEKSLAVIKNDQLRPIEPFGAEFSCQYFELKKLSKPSANPEKDRLLFVLEASADARLSAGGESCALSAEDIFLVQAGETPELSGNAVFMEIYAHETERA